MNDIVYGMGKVSFQIGEGGPVGSLLVQSSDEDSPDDDNWGLVLTALQAPSTWTANTLTVDGTRGRTLTVTLVVPDGTDFGVVLQTAVATLAAVHGQTKPVTPGG